MNHFTYRGDELYCENVAVQKIAAEIGTPFYLYSHATLRQHFLAFQNAFEAVPHLICFSAKSNSNQAVLKLFAGLGGGLEASGEGRWTIDAAIETDAGRNLVRLTDRPGQDPIRITSVVDPGLDDVALGGSVGGLHPENHRIGGLRGVPVVEQCRLGHRVGDLPVHERPVTELGVQLPVLDDAGFATRLAAAARTSAVAQFDWQSIAERYATVLAGPPGRGG